MRTIVIILSLLFVATTTSTQAFSTRRNRHLAAAYVSSSSHSSGGGYASASASAHSVAHGHGNSSPTKAKSVSIASNNASAKTEAVAKDGANVNAKTVAVSKDNAHVKADTKAVGVGKNAKIDVENKVVSDADVIVKRIVVDVGHGKKDVEIIKIIENELTTHHGDLLFEIIKKGLSVDAKTHGFFVKSIHNVIEKTSCEKFIHSIHGKLYQLIAFVPESDSIFKCFYKPCDSFKTSKYCCGSAQMKHEHCACQSDGKCLWHRYNMKEDPSSRFWKCNGCKEDHDVCHCPLA